MERPDIFNLNDGESPDSAFENVYIFGQLNYDFDGDDLKIRSIDVTSE